MSARLETWWEGVMARPAGPVRWGLSALLPLSWLLLEADLLRQSRERRRIRPALPVLSVGNLSLGGTGKSTTVLYLARRLQALGLRPAVVTRGYRGEGAGLPRLVSNGAALLAGPEAGDEAHMLARLLPGVPVAVGKRRERALRLLADETPADLALLDDGFQYYRLPRLWDLVLIDASRATPADRLFPAGYLREPWSHLRRASQVWLTHVDLAPPVALDCLETWLRRLCPVPPVRTCHRLTAVRSPSGETLSVASLRGARVVAVSGLGNPASFEASLRHAGAEVLPLRYPDHHPYGPADLLTIETKMRQNDATLAVTTEKDAVKLEPLDRVGLVSVAECELVVLQGEEMVTACLSNLAEAVRAGG